MRTKLTALLALTFCLNCLPVKAAEPVKVPNKAAVEACQSENCELDVAPLTATINLDGEIWPQCDKFALVLLREDRLFDVVHLRIAGTVYDVEREDEHPVDRFSIECNRIVREHYGLSER